MPIIKIMDYNKIFEKSHEDGAKLLGTKWLKLNERATEVATQFGYKYSDKEMRAFLSKLVLEIGDEFMRLDNLQKEKLQEKYNSEKKYKT